MNTSIPKQVLEKVNEHTKSGFILFYADENGTPQTVPYFDDELSARGLVSYAGDIIASFREIEKMEYRVGFTEDEGEDEG